jgi:hypothetical protein
MPLHRLVLSVLFALAALACPLGATWSIIIIDTRTGAVAVGAATCLLGFDLRRVLPVLLVGRGAACAQSAIDDDGSNRLLIWQQLQAGTDPAQILQLLAQRDVYHQTRQYGIVDTMGRAVSFTGNQAGAWAGQVTGSVGTLVYAIQGNVLTGAPVVAATEAALRNTPGDLADKLMAAMEAARSMGGDGRCSCSQSNPTRCGSPPPSFNKSAEVGFMLVARDGDTDGTCNAGNCASGNYWMALNHFTPSLQDPVVLLRQMFNAWAAQQVGKPDHELSSVSMFPATLPADGLTSGYATVTLRDRAGTKIAHGGATVRVWLDAASTAPVALGPVQDHGNGTYTFAVTPGTVAGTAILRVSADDGSGVRLLSPRTRIEVSSAPLWASTATLSTSGGGQLGFVLNAGPAHAGRAWVLLASNAGSSPGVRLPGGLILPLNWDPVLDATLQGVFGGLFPNLVGLLGPTGRAPTVFEFPPGTYGLRQGSSLSWAYTLLAPDDMVSNPVAIGLVQ